MSEKHHHLCWRYQEEEPGYVWDMHCSCDYIAKVEGAQREKIVQDVLALDSFCEEGMAWTDRLRVVFLKDVLAAVGRQA